MEDTIMEATSRTRPVLGIDVGKRSHWACLVTAEGEIALNAPVANRERDLDELFSGVPGDALVVVDQVRNIGSLALKRAAVAGLESAYLPGTAMHGASRLFAGDAKTDERDALVIAKTAIGIPDSLLPVPRPDAVLDAARAMASQRDYLVAGATRDKNRLRSILLESCPAFESLIDLSDPHCLRMLSEIGGPWQVLDAGKSSVGAVTRGANRARIDALWESISTSTRPDGLRAAAEGASVRLLAKRVSEAASECARLEAEISALLESDATYRCLLTVPGIGPRTASELVIGIDIGEFASHDRLASYCGLAPRNRRSGTSVSSVTASRRGNKRLKNLLVFSCNSLIRSDNRFGAFYRKCRDRGMPHGKALKAVARKRLKVIYAIMRDRVPYAA